MAEFSDVFFTGWVFCNRGSHVHRQPQTQHIFQAFLKPSLFPEPVYFKYKHYHCHHSHLSSVFRCYLYIQHQSSDTGLCSLVQLFVQGTQNRRWLKSAKLQVSLSHSGLVQHIKCSLKIFHFYISTHLCFMVTIGREDLSWSYGFVS